jgi:UDP-N-acetylmuramate--alanine ligase
MQQNAQLALSLAEKLGIDSAKAQKILNGFAGTWRRMEEKGVIMNDVLVIDDYGHHPVEIQATLEALSAAHPKRRLVCVFQPHTHDRTLKLYDDFIESFVNADVVIIPNVYDARHQIETGSVDVPKFVQDIAECSGVEIFDGTSLAETEVMLRTKILQPHDLLVIMGAGDVTKLATSMLR